MKQCNITDNKVITNYKCISLAILMEVNGIGGKELQKSYRQNLNTRLQRTYGDKIMFLSPEYHSPQVVIDNIKNAIINKHCHHQ